MTLCLVGGLAVFVGSGVVAMAGLGAAFIFVPLFYDLGVLLNAVSLSAAAIAGAMMLIYRPRTNVRDRGPGAEAGIGSALAAWPGSSAVS